MFANCTKAMFFSEPLESTSTPSTTPNYSNTSKSRSSLQVYRRIEETCKVLLGGLIEIDLVFVNL